ncbi:plastocyanin/azurin family copper-binding protein [Haloarchaeobius amylolyticus]|uniref:plastocyanin/azurin family copper-binding protein n=1 Tax=Haloarchaeobius amylolyticus TaxID=1198296 RepID=UPI00226FF672|nr:plastocyanin/azurin family copper-binding protein [Haloarchaeobius amylolyticus]
MHTHTRRAFLRAAGPGVLLALAGCLTEARPGDTSTGTTTRTGETWAGPHHRGPHHGEEYGPHHEGGHGPHHGEEYGPHHEGGHGPHHGHHHGDGTDRGPVSAPTAPSDGATVRMVTDSAGTRFDPPLVWVTPGSTVAFELASGVHSATAYTAANGQTDRVPAGAASWDSGTLTEAGATFEHTFEQAGVYDYYCIPHHALGMVGTVVVGRPSLADQPALTAGQSGIPRAAHERLEELHAAVRELVTTA